MLLKLLLLAVVVWFVFFLGKPKRLRKGRDNGIKMLLYIIILLLAFNLAVAAVRAYS